MLTSLGQEDPLEKETATHSSTLAWKIPWMEEHGRLQSTGSQRVGHDWATSLHFIPMRSGDSLMAQPRKNLPEVQETEMWVWSMGQEDLWRRKWQSIPVFLPGKSHGQRRLVGYSPWGCKEADTTEWIRTHAVRSEYLHTLIGIFLNESFFSSTIY